MCSGGWMRITYKGDYAMKAVLQLAVSYNKGVVTIHDLAARTKAPKKFLEQILLELKKGGFVESRRGKIGGYALTKSPASIRVGDVIQFVDGPIEPIPCVNEGYAECEDLQTCLFRGIWKQVAKATLDIVNNVTFDDLAKKIRSQEEVISYSI